MSSLGERIAAARASATLHVWLLVAGIAAAAALLSLHLAGLDALMTPRLPWWMLAVLFFLAEAFPVHLHFRTETHTLSLSELAVVLGLFLSAPIDLVAGIALGSALALTLVRRQRPLKASFNVAQFAFSVGVAVVVFRAIASLGDPHHALGWAAATGGAVAFGLLSVLLVTVTIAVAGGGVHLDELPRIVALALAGSLASASLAIITVELLEADGQAVWLLSAPVAFWAFAFRAYGQQRQRHEHLEFLYRTMRASQSAPDFRVAVRELLVAARDMHSAEYAELLLLGGAADGMLCSVVTDASEELLVPVDAATPATTEAVAHADAADGAIVLSRGRDAHSLDPFASERGLDDALLIALRRDDHVAALLVVGNRTGDVSTFGRDDRRLFETFAAHASVLLENDQVKEQLRYQAYHDALTSLPNRALFAERVGRALAADPEGTTVLFVDLDDFKTINDTLGHSTGDDLLVAVAERVRACMRSDDLAARLGGDEFGVLICHGTAREPDEIAEDCAARIIEALRAPFVLQGREVQARASVGIAHGSDVRGVDELLSNADVAMYTAKAGGKERYALYEPHMHARVRRRHELSAALERALERDEFTVYYQPIVNLADSRTVATEALIRWQHPERGTVLPGSFLPLAEEMRLMVPLGEFVMRTACTQIAAWRAADPGLRSLSVSVNLSPDELRHEQLPDQVEAVLAAAGLEPSSLIVELTESSAMADTGATLRVLSSLQRLGVRIALDDFGTGHSSLSHLRVLPIDILKVAKPFVDRLDSDPDDHAFIDAILRLATALDLTVVAEGVERPEQAHVLRELGCAHAQGFHFARPLAADAVEARLLRTPRRLTRIHAA